MFAFVPIHHQVPSAVIHHGGINSALLMRFSLFHIRIDDPLQFVPVLLHRSHIVEVHHSPVFIIPFQRGRRNAGNRLVMKHIKRMVKRLNGILRPVFRQAFQPNRQIFHNQFYNCSKAFTGSLPNNNSSGFSNNSFTLTKKLTLSLPSIIR